MRFPRFALPAVILPVFLLTPVYAQRGGHSSGHYHGGGHDRGGAFRGRPGGFRGAPYRGGGGDRFYGGRYYGPSLYFGLGGWGVPYYYGYAAPYDYGYDPYYGSGYGPYPYGADAYGNPGYATPQGAAPNRPPNVPYNGYPDSAPGATPAPQSAPSQPPSLQTQPQQPAPEATPEGDSSFSGSSPENYWFVAFRDHRIEAATAYKVDGSEFRWITRDGQEKHAPLSSVDIAYSKELNRDRQVEFEIP